MQWNGMEELPVGSWRARRGMTMEPVLNEAAAGTEGAAAARGNFKQSANGWQG